MVARSFGGIRITRVQKVEEELGPGALRVLLILDLAWTWCGDDVKIYWKDFIELDQLQLRGLIRDDEESLFDT